MGVGAWRHQLCGSALRSDKLIFHIFLSICFSYNLNLSGTHFHVDSGTNFSFMGCCETKGQNSTSIVGYHSSIQ